MTKSKKRPIISSKINEPTSSSSTIAVNEEDPATEVALLVDASSVPVSRLSTPKEKKPPAPKKATNKKGKNGKLSNVLSTTSSTLTNQVNHPPIAQIANIILHLKCSMHDLNVYNDELSKQLTNPLTYNPSVPPDIMAYHHTNNYSELISTPCIISAPIMSTSSSSSSSTSSYDQQDVFAYVESNQHHILPPPASESNVPTTTTTDITITTTDATAATTMNHATSSDTSSRLDMKDIHTKLKKLKISLFKNMAFMDKKSACFWCTYDFDNPECYIPRYEMDGAIHGYGSFCRPECAAAYLMKENLDDSTKFERYHLLNHIYSKVYDYKRNIKPAPNPYYMLDKYYGNLTIQEYRKLLKSDHLLLVNGLSMNKSKW
jgi:hypothetical protein